MKSHCSDSCSTDERDSADGIAAALRDGGKFFAARTATQKNQRLAIERIHETENADVSAAPAMHFWLERFNAVTNVAHGMNLGHDKKTLSDCIARQLSRIE
jgi:hypothetical protein